MARNAFVTAQPLDTPIQTAPGLVHRENQWHGGAAGNRGANGFIPGSHDGSTALGAAKGNRPAFALPPQVAIPTGTGLPFKNLR